MYNPFSLSGKTILVTGASSGIGRAVALECSKMGASLIITGRSEERLDATLRALEGEKHHYLIQHSFCGEEDVKAFMSKLPGALHLDGVVHCAGVCRIRPFLLVKEEDYAYHLSTNLTAPLLLNKFLLKNRILGKGASLVHLSSVSAASPLMGLSAYAASKAGLLGAVRAMAKELMPKGIRINCILPAMVDTEMADATEAVYGKEAVAADKKRYFLERYARPEEVAQMAVYLLSDAAQWITGSDFYIDGGLRLR